MGSRLRVRHPQAGADDTGHDHHDHHRVDVQAQPVEQAPHDHHRQDETDGAPQTDLAVARGLFLQVSQGDHFELRQHRVPEERMQGHHQGQPGVGLADEDQRKTDQGTHRAKPHDGQPPAGVVAQPAPEVGRHATHQHGNGHQLANTRAGEAQVIEIQRQERRRRPEQGEVEQVETGEAPIREGCHCQPVTAGPAPAYSPAHRHFVHGCAADGPSTR